MRVQIDRKAYGAVEVLRDIAFEMGDAERLALMGPSGIGKTTLMRIIAGLDPDFEGALEDVGRVSIAFQEPALLPWRSTRDNITLAARIAPEAADKLLAAVGLEGLGGRFPQQMSLGQQRRVSLARCFARRPDTLLLDEPFASLDREAAASMRALLQDLLRSSATRLILITHDPSEAEALTTRALMLAGAPARIVGATG